MANLKSKLRELINKKGKVRAWVYLVAVYILSLANGDSIVLAFAGMSVYYLYTARNTDDLIRSLLGITIYLLTSYMLLSRKNMLPSYKKLAT